MIVNMAVKDFKHLNKRYSLIQPYEEMLKIISNKHS